MDLRGLYGRQECLPHVVAIVCLLCASTALAAPPKVTRLLVRGLQTGATTRVVVQGSDLLPEPKLLLDLPVKEQKVQGKPAANSVEFDVTLDVAAIPGVYNLRLSNANGITSPEVIAVDHLPQHAAGMQVESLPVAVHGLLAGSSVQDISFNGKKGESVTIDVMARRLGSKLRPVVHLYDAQRHQLTWSLPATNLSGDSRIAATLPADGKYTVAVHDLAYAAAAPAYFRVAIGTFDYVDAVFPAVVSRDKPAALEFVGKLGKENIAKIEASKSTLPVAEVGALAWPAKMMPVGLRPRVQVSDLNELIEGVTLDASRKLPSLPVAVNGRLLAPGEEDVYQIDVNPKDEIRCEVFAERLGSPIDAILELRGEKANRLAIADDTQGADPRVDYTVAAGIKQVTVVVSDAQRRGDAGCVYRLVVSRVEAQQPDFRLTVSEDTHLLAPEGSKVFRVDAERLGYDGPIRVSVDRLPAGFTAAAAEIPAGATSVLIELRRIDGAASVAGGRIAIRGQSVNAKPAIERLATCSTYPLGDLQPWLKADLAIGPQPSPAQTLALGWNKENAAAVLYQGMDDKLQLKLRRGPGAIGPVRLSLLTSQLTPVNANGQPNPMQALRGTAATVDLPLDNSAKAAADVLAKAEKTLADLEKKRDAVKDKESDPKLADEIKAAQAQRDDAQKKLVAAQEKLKDTAEFAITIPPDLKVTDYDLSIRAELRSLDNQTVIAEAYTPPLRLAAKPPIDLVAATSSEITVTLDPKAGATARAEGTVKRLGSFAGDVTLTLVGLPTGIIAPRVVLKPKEDKYQLEIKLPPAFAAEKIDGVKVSATIVPDMRRANVTVKYEQSIPTIRIQKPTPAAAAATTAPTAGT